MKIKRLLFTIILISVFYHTYSQIWIRYTPTQTNPIGKNFIRYVKKTKCSKISNKLNADKLILTDHHIGDAHRKAFFWEDDSGLSNIPSEDIYKEYLKEIFIPELKVLLNKKAEVESVDASGLIVTTINKPEFSKPGKFVLSGIKANSVRIKLKKLAFTKIKVQELLKEIQNYACTINPALVAAVTITDSISWERANSMEIEIGNPNVYYLVQIAELNENLGNSGKYFIDLARLEGNNLVLNNNNPVTNTYALPVISGEFRRVIKEIEVALVYKKTTHYSKPQLIVRYGRLGGSGTEEKQIPMVSDTRWDINNFLVHDYIISTNKNKPVYLNIKAELEGNNIRVARAIFTYPEKEILIVVF